MRAVPRPLMNDGNFPWMPEGCVDDDENNDDVVGCMDDDDDDDENNDDIVGCTVDNDNDNDNDDVSGGGRTLLAKLRRLDVHDDS